MLRVAAVVGMAAMLLLPPMLLYSRAGSEIAIGIVDGAFLIRAAILRDWGWVRRPWLLAALPYWAWLMVCAVAAGSAHGVVQALLIGRFFVLAAGLAEWGLARAAARRRMGVLFGACAAWIAVQSWQQYAFGTNLFGQVRWEDGALTGPFNHPRAGPALLLVFFPALLPPVLRLLSGDAPGRAWRRVAGVGLLVLGVATMVLIGQRMPTLLMTLGLLVAGILLPRLRLGVLAAVAAGALLLALTPILSPPTFAKLYVHFLDQMGHFAASSYGMIYGRALAITAAHPLFGMGLDSFRAACADPKFFVPMMPDAPADGGGLLGCNLHPHNYYLEAATSAGIPGFVLFAGMAVVWLALLAPRGTVGGLQVGLFVTVLLVLWPFGSTSAFYSLPNVGWLFLSLGWGLAEARTAVAVSLRGGARQAQGSALDPLGSGDPRPRFG